MTVLGLGNSCCDTVLELDALPAGGDKLPIRSALQFAGGQIAGAMVGCARLGLQARFLLRTGDDAGGAMQRAALAAAGVDLTHARICPGVPSATATILRDPAGERIVLWHTDERLSVNADEITPALLAGVAAVIVDGKDGAACLRLAQLARQRALPVVGDCDCVYAHTAALIPLLDHLIVPSGFPEPPPRLGQTVVVTAGERGATAHHDGQTLHVPAFPVTAVDTTGAGDAFHAGYIYALLAGFDLQPRLRFASAAAALACTAVGAQTALPTLPQVNHLLGRQP